MGQWRAVFNKSAEDDLKKIDRKERRQDKIYKRR